MVNQDVHNQVVVAERAKAPSGGGRARTTIMTGKVKHECNLRPRMTGRYERRLAARGAAAKNEKAVRVGLMDGAKAGRGGGKMLSSGISSAAGFADLTVRHPRISPLDFDLTGGFFFFRSARKSSRKKDSTSAWRVCRGTNCSTPSLPSFASANSGRSSCSARRRSSRRCISRRCYRKSPRCIAVASSTARGSSCRASRAMAYVVLCCVCVFLCCVSSFCVYLYVGQGGRHVAVVCVAAV